MEKLPSSKRWGGLFYDEKNDVIGTISPHTGKLERFLSPETARELIIAARIGADIAKQFLSGEPFSKKVLKEDLEFINASVSKAKGEIS